MATVFTTKQLVAGEVVIEGRGGKFSDIRLKAKEILGSKGNACRFSELAKEIDPKGYRVVRSAILGSKEFRLFTHDGNSIVEWI